ncbi:hypothetical protein BS78_04G135900 [Paspalum vaginatum]|nr:hypothetical protein BS78_04G135900 [Paspalum vaginatum]
MSRPAHAPPTVAAEAPTTGVAEPEVEGEEDTAAGQPGTGEERGTKSSRAGGGPGGGKTEALHREEERRGGAGLVAPWTRGKTPGGETWSRAPMGETGEGEGAKGERGGKMLAMAAAACAGGAGARAHGRQRGWPGGGVRRGRPRTGRRAQGRGGGRVGTRARVRSGRWPGGWRERKEREEEEET